MLFILEEGGVSLRVNGPAAFDVSGLQPEARRPAVQAAESYYRHTSPWFVGLAAFGSAVRGGFMAGASDIDLHLYLTDGAFGEGDALRLDLSLAIARDLALIDPSPYRYIDCGAERASAPLEEGHVGYPPGTSYVLAGEVPLPEATGEELTAQARWALERLDPEPAFVRVALLQRGSGRADLSATVRAYSQLVWPVVYQVAVLQGEDPVGVWRTPKGRLVGLLDSESGLAAAAGAFNDALVEYYASGESGELGLETIRAGAAFVRAVGDWWRGAEPAPPR